MVQFLSIIFFLGFFNFCWGIQKFPFFCITLYITYIKNDFLHGVDFYFLSFFSFLSFPLSFFLNLINLYLLIVVVEVTVAPDHTQWHTCSVALLLTRDRPVTELSTWQHRTPTTDRHPNPRQYSNPQSQQASGRRPTLQSVRPLYRLHNPTWDANVPSAGQPHRLLLNT